MTTLAPQSELRHSLGQRVWEWLLAQVRALVGLMDEGSKNCMEARDLAQDHLNTVREKIVFPSGARLIFGSDVDAGALGRVIKILVPR